MFLSGSMSTIDRRQLFAETVEPLTHLFHLSLLFAIEPLCVGRMLPWLTSKQARDHSSHKSSHA